MRRLAAFAGGFSLGVFLAQYLLRDGWFLGFSPRPCPGSGGGGV